MTFNPHAPLLVAMFAAFLLSGCAMSQEQITAMNAADDAQCQNYGAKPGSSHYTQCRMFISEQRRQDNKARREAIADALSDVGRGLQQGAAASAPLPPRTCYSSRSGNTVTTNCY